MSRNPVDACDEAAARLNVVLHILERHKCHGEEPKDPINDEDGYDLSIVMESLGGIRDFLRESSAGATGSPGVREAMARNEAFLRATENIGGGER